MNIINPVKVPVKVYYSTDNDAPLLDKSPGCIATIFKACLVTGYGDKEGAGWSLAYEDVEANVKVLRAAVAPEQDFYLRLSNDNGSELTAKVYISMSDINTGELKLQCGTAFKYGQSQRTSGKWMLLATERTFWFLFERSFESPKAGRNGGYFICGDTSKSNNGDKLIYIQHSGGRYGWGTKNLMSGDADYNVKAKCYQTLRNTTHETLPRSFFDSKYKLTDNLMLSPLYVFIGEKCYQLPGIYASSTGAIRKNFDKIENRIVFGLDDDYSPPSNFYFDLDEWVY